MKSKKNHWCNSCCQWIPWPYIHTCYNARENGLTEEEAQKRKQEKSHIYKDFVEAIPLEKCPKCGKSDAMVNGICHHTHIIK